ncbi:MAG TPA: CPBP family intramembrane glutamic endopeptidase, partial [Candidatus Binataceae bacterium]|nr:CPBP family intramembrane glutamic endopeptidase [Candidatus Binataceae bacterium]
MTRALDPVSRNVPGIEPPAVLPRRFTLTFVAALVAGLAAAALLSPLAAMAVAAAGFHFPFPRIFDRTVMVTLAVALICGARRLALMDLLRSGFAAPRSNLRPFVAGLGLSIAVIAVLFTLAAMTSRDFGRPAAWAIAALGYVPAALLIGLLEEGFFRAFLLAGIEGDFGTAVALLGSSGLYAIVHIVRSPARFYLTGFHPDAGLENLAASAARLTHPAAALPTLTGLFLLGLVLGEAFIVTRRVWCSVGLHMGFVLGAKTWRIVAHGVVGIPGWIAGPGPVPLIAAPAA